MKTATIRLGALAVTLIVSGCDVGGYFAEPLTGGEYCSPYWEGNWSTEKSEDDRILDGDETGIRVAVSQPTSCNDATFSAEVCIAFVGQPPLCVPAAGRAEFVRSNGRVYANVRLTEIRGAPVTDRGLDLVEIRAATDSRLEAAFAQRRVLKALVEDGKLEGSLDQDFRLTVTSGGEELARVLAKRPEVFTEHTHTFLKQ